MNNRWFFCAFLISFFVACFAFAQESDVVKEKYQEFKSAYDRQTEKRNSMNVQVAEMRAIFDDSEWTVVEARNAGKKLSSTLFEGSAVTQGKFIIVVYQLLNKGKEQAFDLATPNIVDGQGREFGESDVGTLYLPEDAEPITLQAIPSGISKTFWAVYEVPSDARGLKFQAYDLSRSGKEKPIDLGL